jgi:hypothetical protein
MWSIAFPSQPNLLTERVPPDVQTLHTGPMVLCALHNTVVPPIRCTMLYLRTGSSAAVVNDEAVGCFTSRRKAACSSVCGARKSGDLFGLLPVSKQVLG